MRTVLISLTIVEIVLVVWVISFYLIRISRSLFMSAQHLAKVTFGVRAVETQCASIGPSVTRINEQLDGITAALSGIADRAESLADR